MKRQFVIYILFSMTMIFQMQSYAHAGFVITMKNGRSIPADKYQVKGDTIVILFEEGTLTFSKQEIKSIKEDMGMGKTVGNDQRVMRQTEKEG